MRGRVEPFRAIAISQLARALEAGGRSVVHMEFGQPSTPAPAAARAAVRDALERDPPGYWESLPRSERIAGHYLPPTGAVYDHARILLHFGDSTTPTLSL